MIHSYHYTTIGDSVVYHQSMFLKKLSSQVYSGDHKRTWREKLGEFLESKPEQIVIFFLIVLDLLVIVAQLFIVEPAIRCGHHNEHVKEEYIKAAEALDIVSLGILSILGLEMVLLLIAFDKRFFKQPLYIIDTLVIGASMVFEIEQRNHNISAGSLLIFFRLWRIVRIVHGVAMSVQEKNEEQIKLLEEEVQKLKKEKTHIVQKFDYIKKRYKKLVDATKDEIASLPPQYVRNRKDLTREEEDSNMLAESLPSPTSPAMIHSHTIGVSTSPPSGRSITDSPFKSPGAAHQASHPHHHVQIQEDEEGSESRLSGSNKDYSTFNK